MSITWVFGGSLFLMLPIGALLWFELSGGPLAGASFALIAGAILFIIIVGLMIASVTGYMAGLIGASNSPVSGIGILAIIASSLLLLRSEEHTSELQSLMRISYAVFCLKK